MPSGGSGEFNSSLFVGPKLSQRMEEISPGLELTVDYGWLTFLSKPLYWLLAWFHGFVGNWGVAIILLTLTIKGAFYKLSETSYKSMAKMRKVSPRLKTLKERYGDDRQRMNQEMMKLYKEEKINPMGWLSADPGADSGLHRALLGRCSKASICARRPSSCGSRICR